MQVRMEHIMVIVEDLINRQNLNKLMWEKMIITVYETEIFHNILRKIMK